MPKLIIRTRVTIDVGGEECDEFIFIERGLFGFVFSILQTTAEYPNVMTTSGQCRSRRMAPEIRGDSSCAHDNSWLSCIKAITLTEISSILRLVFASVKCPFP